MTKVTFYALFAAALTTGLALRIWRLDLRPMHHDEANQALKFGALLETGEYRYDRSDHHGPTLYYLTLPFARISGRQTVAALDERVLRSVPAVFGVGLILLFLFPIRGLGREAVLWSALLAALSPALTYYSRFYIQESVFTFFAIGFLVALGRYALRPAVSGALVAGLFAGLAYATKETSIIVFGAAGGALLLTVISIRALLPARGARPDRYCVRGAHAGIGLGAAAIIAVVMYSSFFRNPAGIFESVRAFGDYAARALEAGLHAHPWYFYFQILAFTNSGGLIWTEGMILLLAGIAAIRALGSVSTVDRGDGGDPAEKLFWPRYIALYSLFAATAFSLVRYKTPWNLLPFYAGLVLLAGSGAAILRRRATSGMARGLLLIALVAGCIHLGVQNLRANYRYPADPRNPYVYAQTSPDFLRLVQRIRDLAAIHPDGRAMLVTVIAGPYEQWPLPWYLRDLRRIGYWTAPEAAGGFEGVPVVISSQENAGRLEGILGPRFQAEFYGLRPGILLTMYIDRDLWDQFLRRR